MGGIDCSKAVSEYDDKMTIANAPVIVSPPTDAIEAKEGEETKLDPAKAAELRIQESTAKTHKDEALKYLLDTVAKMDWQAP